MFKNEDLWELYADDLVITAENKGHLQKKVQAWQKYLESAGLMINVDKTQVNVSSKEVGNGIAIHDVRGSIIRLHGNIFDLL